MLNSEIHSEGELNNKPEVSFIENLPELVKELDEANFNTIEEIDNFLWKFTRSQLVAATNNFKTKDEVIHYLSENVNMNDLFLPEILKKIVDGEIVKLAENGIDMTDKSISASISLDMDLNRKIELRLIDNTELDDGGFKNFNNDLPDFNPVLEKQIETLCKQMLCGILDDKEIDEFIKDRCEDYKEEPFTIDYLEGFITGFISDHEN